MHKPQPAMKKTTLLIYCFLLLNSTYAQTNKDQLTTTKSTTADEGKSAPSSTNIKPIVSEQNKEKRVGETSVGQSEGNATIPKKDLQAPITKYELYSLIRKHLETNNFKNWVLTERLSNFYITYKEPVSVVSEKSEIEYESETKEVEALSKIYLPKTYELSVEFTSYDTEALIVHTQDQKVFSTQLDELKTLYQIDEIFENTETKEYYALDNDERNRLSKYMLAKIYLENSPGKESPNLYVQNFAVTLKYQKDYYRTIPKQVSEESVKIIQFLENTLRNNQ